MSAGNEAFIPQELVPIYQEEGVQRVHEWWSGVDLEGVMESMPDLQTYRSGSDELIRYADLLPGKEFDEEHVLALRLPISNGLTPHMLIRAMLIQDLLPQPTRMRIFPNDTRRTETTVLTDDSRAKIVDGDFRPLAELQQGSIESDLGEDTVVDLSGYSLGASVALAHAAIAETRSVDACELPNVTDRTPKAVARAALNGNLSYRPYNQAVIDSAIPALVDAFGIDSNPRMKLRQMLGGLSFALDNGLPNNKAMQTGLSHDRAVVDVTAAFRQNPDLAIVIGKSAGDVCPPRDLARLMIAISSLANPEHKSYESYMIFDYAHEAGDNIWIPALISRRARRLAVQAAESS